MYTRACTSCMPELVCVTISAARVRYSSTRTRQIHRAWLETARIFPTISRKKSDTTNTHNYTYLASRTSRYCKMPLSAWTRATITGILVALAPSPGISTGEPCTSDQQCMNGTDWRCVEAPAGIKGAPCTLDYGYNTTGECVCSSEGSHAVCVGGSYAEPTAGAKQYLVIGDSVSMGYFGTLKNNLTSVGIAIFVLVYCMSSCLCSLWLSFSVWLPSLWSVVAVRT